MVLNVAVTPGKTISLTSFCCPEQRTSWKFPLLRQVVWQTRAHIGGSLAMGAEGMNMGTRFFATQEAPVHDNVKQAILNASELNYAIGDAALRNTERVLTNPAVERLLEKEKAMGSELKFEDIAEEVAGVYPKVMTEGDMDIGAWSCGMVAGLVYDIPTVQELMDRIMGEADALISERLARFSAA